MLNDASNLSSVRGIIALAKTFRPEVVAQGIETTDIYQKLPGMGCEIGQGYGALHTQCLQSNLAFLGLEVCTRLNKEQNSFHAQASSA